MAKEKPKKPSKLDYSKKTSRMDFEVKGKRSVIWVRQYWEYNYLVRGGAGKWGPLEKKAFHRGIEKVIRKAWSGKFVLEVSGESDFAKWFAGKTLDVKFDIDAKKSGAHWKVKAFKVPKGTAKTSKVNWPKMIIQLDTEDTKGQIMPEGEVGETQTPAAHEFGHAIGNTKHIPGGHGDEYKDTSQYRIHRRSIMHSGMKIKYRHADYLVSELNKMIPQTTFSVKSVK
jgi:hypothetical protein